MIRKNVGLDFFFFNGNGLLYKTRQLYSKIMQKSESRGKIDKERRNWGCKCIISGTLISLIDGYAAFFMYH